MTSSQSNRVIYWGSGSIPAWRALATLHAKGLLDKFESKMVEFSKGVLCCTTPCDALCHAVLPQVVRVKRCVERKHATVKIAVPHGGCAHVYALQHALRMAACKPTC